MHQRTTELIQLMEEHQLNIKTVAEMMGVARSTVKVWRCATGLNIPAAKLELLRMKVAAQKTA